MLYLLLLSLLSTFPCTLFKDPCDRRNPFKPPYCYPENAYVITNYPAPLRSTPPIPVTIRSVIQTFETEYPAYNEDITLRFIQLTTIPMFTTTFVHYVDSSKGII